MNLTDLTMELQTRASDAVPAPALNRLTGVRRRIRTRRRKQVASATGLAALAIAGVLLVPGMSQLRADRVPTPPATAVPTDPLSFAADLAGDPLIATGVSTPGAGELVVRFTPTDTRLATSFFCRTPGVSVPADGRSAFVFSATINGHRYSPLNDCSEDDGPNGATISHGDVASKENRDSWAELGVQPGQESVLRLTVKAAKGTSAVPPTTRLGVGVYALTGERVLDGGVSIKVQAKIDGHQYRLAGHRTAPATAKRHRLSLTVPAGRHPVAVLYGNPGDTSDDADQGFSLAVDGQQKYSSGSGGVTASDELLDDARAHTLELRLDSPLRGTMVLAYYVRVD